MRPGCASWTAGEYGALVLHPRDCAAWDWRGASPGIFPRKRCSPPRAGILAVQTRRDALAWLESLNDPDAQDCAPGGAGLCAGTGRRDVPLRVAAYAVIEGEGAPPSPVWMRPAGGRPSGEPAGGRGPGQPPGRTDQGGEMPWVRWILVGAGP